ncbi:MAG: PepSY-associated TM helix domain-containing protein [Steroidobacteraceae bacterium]
MLKKILFNVHWAVGITVGIALAIMGTTGAMMSFEDEILSVLNGRPAHVAATGPALSLAQIDSKVREANPGKAISAITLASDPEQAVKVEFARGGARPRPGEDDGSRYFNQYTGEMIPASAGRGVAFMAWVEHLHRRLAFWRNQSTAAPAAAGQGMSAGMGAGFGDAPAADRGEGPGAGGPPNQQGMGQEVGQMGMAAGGNAARVERAFDLGEQATSYAVLCLMIMALTGLYLRWPRRKATEWRSWLKINFKLKGYAFNYNLHAVIGTVVFLGYLMSAHSGLMMSEVKWYGNSVRALAGVQDERVPRGGAQRANEVQYSLDTLWAAFQREVPEFNTATVQLSNSNAGDFQITYLLNHAVTKEGGRNINTVVLDAETGAVKRHDLFSDKPALQRVITRNFDLHSGGFFGTPGRIFIMCTSLMMPVLLVTGWMQYLARRRQKKQRAAALKAAQG